jgi:competence protein ComFC
MKTFLPTLPNPPGRKHLTAEPDKGNSWLDAVLGFVYPETCQVCHIIRSRARDGFVCDSCRRSVRFIEAPLCDKCGLPFSGEITSRFECGNCRGIQLHFDHARSAVEAKGLVLDVLHRYKYNRALWFEPFLASLLIARCQPALQTQGCELIVPVPLHPLKQREREYNQAERLANRLSDATQIPTDPNLLRRTVHTATQTRLSRSQRARNVRRAFALTRPIRLEGRRILLVDDVLTTGATTSACAIALREAGALHVSVWTVARGT